MLQVPLPTKKPNSELKVSVVQFLGTQKMELEAKVEQFSCQVSNKETNIDSAKDALKMLESEIQAPEVYKAAVFL